MIPHDQYQAIVDALPILCVDLVLTNARGEYLLVKRKNPPLQGQWWVPGGRVLKGERLAEAAIRKLGEELSLVTLLAGPVGYCEYLLADSPHGSASGHHAVALVFTGLVLGGLVELDGQSSDWGFFPTLPHGFTLQGFVNDGSVSRT